MAKDKEGDEAIPLAIIKPEGFSGKDPIEAPANYNRGRDAPGQRLPLLRIADANDFVRLHPSEENYWWPAHPAAE